MILLISKGSVGLKYNDFGFGVEVTYDFDFLREGGTEKSRYCDTVGHMTLCRITQHVGQCQSDMSDHVRSEE